MQSRLYDTDYVVKTVMVPTSRQVWIKIDSQWDQQELGRVNGARPHLCVCWVAPLVHWRSRPDSQTPSGMSVEERQATVHVLELLVTSSLKIHTLSLYIHSHTRMHTCHTHATHIHVLSDIPTSQGFYEGDVFMESQFRSPSWTRFPDHLRLLIILHCIVDLHCYYCPPKEK